MTNHEHMSDLEQRAEKAQRDFKTAELLREAAEHEDKAKKEADKIAQAAREAAAATMAAQKAAEDIKKLLPDSVMKALLDQMVLEACSSCIDEQSPEPITITLDAKQSQVIRGAMLMQRYLYDEEHKNRSDADAIADIAFNFLRRRIKRAMSDMLGGANLAVLDMRTNRTGKPE